MPDIKLNPAIPILRIYGVAKAKEFYIDFLGFTLDWEHRFDDNAPKITDPFDNVLRFDDQTNHT